VRALKEKNNMTDTQTAENKQDVLMDGKKNSEVVCCCNRGGLLVVVIVFIVVVSISRKDIEIDMYVTG